MLHGLYRIRYRTPEMDGTCVCIFKEGQIAGGGEVMYYTGTYEETGGRFVGTIHARRHARASKPSPIKGLDEFHVQLDGLVTGEYGQTVGKIAEAPDATLQASFLRLSSM